MKTLMSDHQRLDLSMAFKELWKAIGPITLTRTRPYHEHTLWLKEWIMDNPQRYDIIVVERLEQKERKIHSKRLI